MPEKKRPALSVSPLPSEVVWTKASSTDTVLSAPRAMLVCPRSQGSMLADRVSSLSARLKPRLGPSALPAGVAKPVTA